MNEREKSSFALIGLYVTHEGWEYTTIHSIPSMRILLSDLCTRGDAVRNIYELCKQRASNADVFIVRKNEWVSRSGLHELYSAGIAPALSTARYDIFVFRQLVFVGSEKPKSFDELLMRALAKIDELPRRVGYFAWRTRRGFHELELVEPLPPGELAHFIVPKDVLEGTDE